LDKIALITGASSGIGEKLSINLSCQGYYVLLASRNIKKLKKIESILKSKGKASKSFQLDICDQNSIQQLNNDIKKIGIPDIIINNAGIGTFAKIEDVTAEEWRKQIDTNLSGPFLVVKSFISDMKKRKKGTLVFINSVAGKYGYPFSQAYVSSKFGLRGLADSLRNELRKDNIKVVSVFPGAVDTAFWDGAKVDFPNEEMLSSENVANVIVSNILSENNLVVEDMVIRRTQGDF